MTDVTKTLYIAGPMRGIAEYNFPAFLEAENQLKSMGYKVLSPATQDVLEGFETHTPESELTGDDFERWVKRDMDMVSKSDGVCVLPGFEKSKGAQVEVTVARFLNKPVYTYPSMAKLEVSGSMVAPASDILVEALRITSGDRQNQYGPPDQDFARTAKMWSALKGVEFTTEEVASFLCCVKLSRNTHQSKRDNWVDLAGYARCGDICRQEREKRNA